MDSAADNSHDEAGADNIHSAASAASPSPHHLSPSSSETPTHSASPSPSPSPRPGLSRTNSVSYFTAEADDSFTGLTLLDALVVLDSHLDLASRNLKKKGLEWKHKAEHTANSVKRQAEEVLNQGRRRTKGLRTSSSYGSELRRRGGSNRTQEEEEDDRIYIDKEVAKLRENISTRVRAVRAKWQEQRIVSLRDKLSFFLGVELVLFSALLVGFRPEWVPRAYTALALYLFPIRIHEYRRKSYGLFLADMCYIVNVLCLLYIWVFPNSPVLFVACYCLSHGPLCTAIATWRNSLVFHSVDKVTSLFIHIYPPFVFTCLRHFIPNASESYPALAELPHLNVWRSLLFSSIAYLIWQVGYYYGIIVARKNEIEQQGKMTSFTYMLHNKRSIIGKTLAKIPPAKREVSFMAGQFVYTIVTMAPSAIWLYDSKVLSSLWLIVFFSVSVFNGASFYFKIMDNFKDITALRKELDELQKEVEGRRTPASIATPGTSAIGPASESGSGDNNNSDVQDLHLGESLTSSASDRPALDTTKRVGGTRSTVALIDANDPPVASAAKEGIMDATTMVKDPKEADGPLQVGAGGATTSGVGVDRLSSFSSSSSKAASAPEASNGSPVVPELRLSREGESRDDNVSSADSDGSAVVVDKEE